MLQLIIDKIKTDVLKIKKPEQLYPNDTVFVDDETKEIFTKEDTACFDCDEKEKCKFAFDAYNINDDCLAIAGIEQ